MDTYDIAIIGLGPGGATLARLLPKELSVVALDKKQAAGESGFHKPCGGLLAPDAQKALARMGLNLKKDILVDPQIFSVRTMDLDSGLCRHYLRNYVNIDRHKFDLWLKSLIPDHVQVYHGTTCLSIEESPEGFLVRYRSHAGEHTLCAKALVGADGAKSLVRQFVAPKKQLRQYLSIQEWFAEENATPFYSCIFDAKQTDCYSWSISKDGYFIFGGAYPLSHAPERFEAQKQALRARGFVMGTPVKKEACMVLRPRGFRDFVTGRPGVYLIGEAAGFISPSSLEGISYALDSALALAEVLRKGQDFTAYDRRVKNIKWKLFFKTLKCPFLYAPHLRYFVMKSGLSAIEVMDSHN